MPKKCSSKKPKQVQEQENPVVELENPFSKPKKPGNEIDQIFSGKKRKKAEVEKEKTDKENGDETEKPKLIKKNKKKSKGAKEIGFADPPARSRKRTVDGLTIYTEEELGLSKGDAGGTPLCPFDCDCCV